MILLYTYSESNTTTIFSAARRRCRAYRTSRSSPLLTLYLSMTRTGNRTFCSCVSPNQAPYPACHHPMTCFADPLAYTNVKCSASNTCNHLTTPSRYWPYFWSLKSEGFTLIFLGKTPGVGTFFGTCPHQTIETVDPQGARSGWESDIFSSARHTSRIPI